jgi:hypothetical protein
MKARCINFFHTVYDVEKEKTLIECTELRKVNIVPFFPNMRM